MRFTLRHTFNAPVERVEEAVLDPVFEERLEALPNVAERTVTRLDRHEDGTVDRVVHYRFGGQLPGAVRRAIGASSVSWDEVGSFDPAAHEWRFEIRPDVFEGGFECRGSYRFDGRDGVTVREVEVDMRVKVPVVGRLVENAIRDGLVHTMNAEAEMLDDFLAER